MSIKDILVDGSDYERIGSLGNLTVPGGMWRGRAMTTAKLAMFIREETTLMNLPDGP